MNHHILKRIDRHTALQFFKFLIVGCINTGLSLAVIYILQNGFDVKYTKANLIGYILGVINSFFWNKLWVFQKKDGKFVSGQISGGFITVSKEKTTILTESAKWNDEAK